MTHQIKTPVILQRWKEMKFTCNLSHPITKHVYFTHTSGFLNYIKKKFHYLLQYSGTYIENLYDNIVETVRGAMEILNKKEN